MRAGSALGLIAVATLTAAPARAQDPSANTERTAPLRLSRVAPGLEASLPRGGTYARALVAARGRQYRRARELFFEAAAEQRHAFVDGSAPRARALALMNKAEHEATLCELLLREERETAEHTQFALHLLGGLTLRELYLTSRAFLGRDDPVLYDRAEKEFQAALKAAQSERPQEGLTETYLAYGALLAVGGERRAARNALAVVRPSQFSRGDGERAAKLFLLVAAARTALGDRQLALDAIAAARDLHPRWRQLVPLLRASNDLDPLRDDPRLAELLGEEE